MEVHLTPDLEQQLNAAAAKAGRRADELAQDAIAGYLFDLAAVRHTLDTRYDDVKSGKVKLIPGDEVETHFREKSAAAKRAWLASCPATPYTRKPSATSMKFGNSSSPTT